MPKILPPSETLRQILEYNAESGILTWRRNPERSALWNGRYAGKPALNYIDDQGYKIGKVAGSGNVKAHRVIWKIVTGQEAETVDHINHVRTDNRFCNLRSVSARENARNCGPRIENLQSGVMGVYWYGPRSQWVAKLYDGNRLLHLGYFDEVTEAAIVRKAAEIAHGFHPNHGRADVA